MTIRAVIIGAMAAVLIGGAGYFNDSVLKLTYVVGNHLPISVMGILVLVVIGWNPLAHLLFPRAKLRPAELAVMVLLMFTACSIPGSGLMRTFMHGVALPLRYEQQSPGWQRNELLSYVPPSMYVTDERAVQGYYVGLGTQQHTIGLDDVPWHAWTTPLATWLPLILLLAGAVICLSLIVHRQWSVNEGLRYPIATVIRTLSEDDGRAVPPIFRTKLFWIFAVAIFLVHVINGYDLWEHTGFTIPRIVDCMGLLKEFKVLANSPQGFPLTFVHIYPAVVGFAFFLAMDVSFSLGISQILYALIAGTLILGGVNCSGDLMTGGPFDFQRFGGYVGIALLLLYTGRSHYWRLFLGAVFLGRNAENRMGVWAVRMLLLCVAGFVAMLCWLGMDWPAAVLLVLLMLMLFTVAARINVEGGLFFLQAGWTPVAVMAVGFGVGALGPSNLVLIALVTAVFALDPRECLMPFIVNGLKLCDDRKALTPAAPVASAGVFTVALGVAVVVVLWATYNYGVPQGDGWAISDVPQMPFRFTNDSIDTLKATGTFDKSVNLSTAGRVGAGISYLFGNGTFLFWAGLGLVSALLLSYLRLRIPRWPLHPVLLLVWGTYPISWLSHSFLLGFIVKFLVVRLGGTRGYNAVKPAMIGLIVGEVAGAFLWMIVGLIYHFTTGYTPPKYMIFPG